MTFPMYGKIKNVPNHQPNEYGWALGDLKINVKTPKSSKFVAPNLLKFLLCGGVVKKYNTTRIECFITILPIHSSQILQDEHHIFRCKISMIFHSNSHSISQSIIPFSGQAMVKKIHRRSRSVGPGEPNLHSIDWLEIWRCHTGSSQDCWAEGSWPDKPIVPWLGQPTMSGISNGISNGDIMGISWENPRSMEFVSCFSGWWVISTPLKNDGVKVSWDSIIFQRVGCNHQPEGYLNINLCYECFRDVKVGWIRRYDRRSASVYLPWMLWRLGPRGAPGSPSRALGVQCDLTNKQ